MATHDFMYDSNAHICMSRITSESPDLTEDSDLPSSPVAQPSEESPNLVQVLPDVPDVHVYPLSLNLAPKFSKKRPLKSISDLFPMDVSPYPIKAMPGLVVVNDILNFLGRMHLLLYLSPPKSMWNTTMRNTEDTPTKQL